MIVGAPVIGIEMHRERWFSKTKVRDCQCGHPEWTHGQDLGRCRAEKCECLRYKGQKRANKYNATRTEFKGKHYDSKFEGRQASEFAYQVDAKLIKAVRTHVKLVLEAEGVFITNYYVDFEVTHLDGTIEYVETKGVETDSFQIKKRLMQIYLSHHPGTSYTIVKERRGRSFLKSELKQLMDR